jgi:hypothetical protein
MKHSLLLSLALALMVAGGASANVVINEVDYQNPGTDSTEWVELAGAAGTDLSGWTLLFLNQAQSLYKTVVLNGTIPSDFTSPWGGDGGFYVVGQFDATTSAAFPGALDQNLNWGTNQIQNGPDDIIQLWNAGGVLMDEWQYDSDNPGTTSFPGYSQTFAAFDSAGTGGDIATYSSIGRIGYSYDQPLFAFDDPQAQLGVQGVDDRFDHDANITYSGTGPAWSSPAYTGAAFVTTGPYTEASPAEIQWSGTASYGAHRGLSPGTFNNASYGMGGQDPYTINIVPEPATLALFALGGLALLRRR